MTSLATQGIPFSPEAAAAAKHELYTQYFRPWGRLVGDMMITRQWGEQLDGIYNRTVADHQPFEDLQHYAHTAATLAVATSCGELGVRMTSRLLAERAGLLPWLAKHANALYLDSKDGHAPYPLTEESLCKALELKTMRNTLLGYGHVLLWVAGVDRYMQRELPQEYAAGLLPSTLACSTGLLNWLAAVTDQREMTMLSKLVTGEPGIALDTQGNIPDIMAGRMYVDPALITHRGGPGRRELSLAVKPSSDEPNEATPREGCPMLQKPFAIGRSYIFSIAHTVTRYYLCATGYNYQFTYKEGVERALVSG